MEYFKNPQTNEVFAYDETDPTQLPYIEQAINNGWQNITGSYPTDDMKKEQCVSQAKYLIAQADWSMLPDVGLANVSDFTAYRATLRALILNPVADPVFPTEPQPVWE